MKKKTPTRTKVRRIKRDFIQTTFSFNAYNIANGNIDLNAFLKSILIVGHGLAGAILAHTLINRGIKVTCTEGQIKHSASRIAAGLINPFIGPDPDHRLHLESAWKVISNFFRKWEEEFGEKLYKSESLIRIFTSQKQANKWIDLTKNETTSKPLATYSEQEA